MIYLASPYTHERESVMDRRFRQVTAATAYYISEGFVIYSPILHFHPIAVRHELPRDFEFWRHVNEQILLRCDQMWVLKLPGWRESKGVQSEIKFALANNIPVKEVNAKQWS